MYGIAIGSPLAPALADIFMNHLLEGPVKSRESDWRNIVISDILQSCEHLLKFFVRYVDDTLVCFDTREEAVKFLEFLNRLHPSIRFTMEHECDFGKIPFLDLWIMKEDGKIEITVYRKGTHSGVYTHFSSFIPKRFKRQLIVTLLERAYNICSNYTLLHIEFDNLKVMLKRNGYNENFIYSIIRDFLNKKRSVREKVEGPEQFKVFITLPYLGEASEKVRGSISSCLSRVGAGGIRVVFLNNYNSLGRHFPYKDRQPKHLANGVVYRINCSCGVFYIGETARCCYTRFLEHNKSTGASLTEVGKHLKDNPTVHTLFGLRQS